MKNMTQIAAELAERRNELREHLVARADMDDPADTALVNQIVEQAHESDLDELVEPPESPGLRAHLGMVSSLREVVEKHLNEAAVRKMRDEEQDEWRSAMAGYVGSPGSGGPVSEEMARYVGDTLMDLDDIYEADDDCDINFAYGRLSSLKWALGDQ